MNPSEQSLRIKAVNQWYDWRMFTPEEALSGGFANYGYWEWGTRTHKQACENLLERLLGFLPEKKGAILDVACGKGATTRYLLNFYKPKNIMGINISVKQLKRCKANAPGCTFVLMDAAELAFKNNSFDNIICVEAAFHFTTREKFLQEAHRVLKPGGRVVLSDILRTRTGETGAPTFSARNYIKDPAEYRTLCSRAGFNDVEIIDATDETWVRFYRVALRWSRLRFNTGEIDWSTFDRQKQFLFWKRRIIRYYLLVSARKPRPEEHWPLQSFPPTG